MEAGKRSPVAKRHGQHQALALCLISVARSLKSCFIKSGESFVCHSSSNSVKVIFNATVREPFMISVGVFSFSPSSHGLFILLDSRDCDLR